MGPGILILVVKLENITFGGCQVNSTPTMYCRSQSELRYIQEMAKT